MRRSNLIRISDVQPILNLVAETAEVAPTQRLSHLLGSLPGLFGARACSAGVTERRADGMLRPVSFSSIGFEACDLRAYSEMLSDSRGSQVPMAKHVAAKIAAQDEADFAFDRRVAFSDDEWYRSSHAMNYCRSLRVDESLFALCLVPGTQQAAGLCLLRPWGDRRPFSRRSTKLLEMLLQATKSLLIPRAPHLPRRQRQVLDLLLAGKASKEIAAELHISIHTAEEHLGALYRKYGVSGRSELMSLFVK